MVDPTWPIPLHGSGKPIFHPERGANSLPGEKGRALLKPTGVMKETRRSKWEKNAYGRGTDFVDFGFSVYSVAFQKAFFLFNSLCFYCTWEIPKRCTDQRPGTAELLDGSAPML